MIMNKIKEVWKKFESGCLADSSDIFEDDLVVEVMDIHSSTGDVIDTLVEAKITASIFWWNEFEPYLIDGVIIDGFSCKVIIGECKYEWQKMVRLARAEYDQTHPVSISYGELREIYIHKKNLPDPEWRLFCDWLRIMPGMVDLINDI